MFGNTTPSLWLLYARASCLATIGTCYYTFSYRILYERDIIVGDIFSEIWCYRSVFDSQHFKNKLFSRGLQKEANRPFLAIFCKNRNLLSATIYLPDIVQLMLKLSHKKYMRIIKRDGTNYSIEQFVEKIKYG